MGELSEIKSLAESNIGSEYPLNLLDAVDSDNVWQYPGPADINGTVEYLLHTFLSQRENDILHQRFKLCKTYAEIGEIYQITGERVRKIEEKALNRLRSPGCMKYLQNGISKATQIDINNAAEQAVSAELSTAVAYLRELLINKTRFLDERPVIVTAKTEIEDLNLSVRCYNSVKRAGINKVGDLEKITFRELRLIRNLGKHSLDELIGKLAEQGVAFQEETDPDEKIVLQRAPIIG